jgi:hypothetical protein
LTQALVSFNKKKYISEQIHRLTIKRLNLDMQVLRSLTTLLPNITFLNWKEEKEKRISRIIKNNRINPILCGQAVSNWRLLESTYK